MAGYENNIHKRNITLYAKLVHLIKEIKPEIDKICNDIKLKILINNPHETHKNMFDNYKKKFNYLVNKLPNNIDKIENKYNSDDSEFNFPLLGITIQRTIVQIEEIILAFQSICIKNNNTELNNDLKAIRTKFKLDVKNITQDAGKIKKKKKSKKRKTKNKKRKSKKKKLNNNRNKTKKSKK
jgi:hypothetical protein